MIMDTNGLPAEVTPTDILYEAYKGRGLSNNHKDLTALSMNEYKGIGVADNDVILHPKTMDFNNDGPRASSRKCNRRLTCTDYQT